MSIVRTECIVCPNCETAQDANVEMTPYHVFPAYVHNCENCEYIIMESEWETVDDRKYSTPETEHLEMDDDPILWAALKRVGMRFDSEHGWYWPFTEYQPPVYPDTAGHSESTQPYLW